MSGACKKQPVIFYTEEMTETKIYLLQQQGIKFNMFKYSLCEKKEEE